MLFFKACLTKKPFIRMYQFRRLGSRLGWCDESRAKDVLVVALKNRIIGRIRFRKKLLAQAPVLGWRNFWVKLCHNGLQNTNKNDEGGLGARNLLTS